MNKAGIKGEDVGEVYLGNVINAGMGQAPSRQAALGAGIPQSVPTTDINKVCASGMKAVMLAAQNIALGQQSVMVAGGFESMSQIPHIIPGIRFGGFKYGHGQIVDALVADGLTDVYNKFHMGMCAEDCSKKHSISREEQDRYTVQSYQRAAKAWSEGKFADEVAPVTLASKNGETVTFDHDEEYKNVKYDKISKLKPAFTKDGTVTAANASKLNDGASALVLMSAEKASSLGLKPLARIR